MKDESKQIIRDGLEWIRDHYDLAVLNQRITGLLAELDKPDKVEPGDHPRLLQDAIIKHVQLQGRIDELTARADKLAEALNDLMAAWYKLGEEGYGAVDMDAICDAGCKAIAAHRARKEG
jgi:hypothetical protein